MLDRVSGQHHFLASSQLKSFSHLVEGELGAFAHGLDQNRELEMLMDPLMRGLFDQCMEKIQADSGAIWLTNPERTRLMVCYADREASLVGLEHPLGKGLIGLVVALEQSICEDMVFDDQKHSKDVDEKLGKVTSSMVAVPFYIGGQLKGVLSAVKWRKPESASPKEAKGFEAKDLYQVQNLATLLERLLNYRIIQILFDLERGQI